MFVFERKERELNEGRRKQHRSSGRLEFQSHVLHFTVAREFLARNEREPPKIKGSTDRWTIWFSLRNPVLSHTCWYTYVFYSLRQIPPDRANWYINSRSIVERSRTSYTAADDITRVSSIWRVANSREPQSPTGGKEQRRKKKNTRERCHRDRWSHGYELDRNEQHGGGSSVDRKPRDRRCIHEDGSPHPERVSSTIFPGETRNAAEFRQNVPGLCSGENTGPTKGNLSRPVSPDSSRSCSLLLASRKRNTPGSAFIHTWTTVGARLLPPPWFTTTWTLAMPQHPLVNMYL